MSKEFTDVIEFNKKVIDLAVLDYLSEERLNWFKNVINEELGEFEQANAAYCALATAAVRKGINVIKSPTDTMLDAKAEMIDAIIDLIYFAYGRLYEIGVTDEEFDTMWAEVQKANMTKIKGNKGRGSDEDAIKPEGWQAPEKNFKLSESKWTTVENPLLKLQSDLAKSMVRAIDETHEEAPKTNSWVVRNIDDLPKVFIEAAELCRRKSQDYNNGQDKPASRRDYFPFGLISYAQMLHTKTQRLNSLAQQTKAPNNESIRDTLIDLINYASFAVDAIDKGEI